jgi:hypothetical protein
MPTARHQADATHARLERRDVYRPSKAIRYGHVDALFGGD